MQFLKHVFVIYNLFLVASGIGHIVIGTMAPQVLDKYGKSLEKSFFITSFALIFIGSVLVTIAITGSIGSYLGNHCLVNMFSIIAFGMFALELSAGIGVFVLIYYLGDDLKKDFGASLIKYIGSETMRETWDLIQHKLKCCGMTGPEDWKIPILNLKTPFFIKSCCEKPVLGTICPRTRRYTRGCMPLLGKKAVNAGGAAIFSACFELIGVLIACGRAHQIIAKQLEDCKNNNTGRTIAFQRSVTKVEPVEFVQYM